MIGSVVERKLASQPSTTPRFTAKPGIGFPAVQHRSKSAFARAREETKVNNADIRSNEVPVVVTTQPPVTAETKTISTDVEDLRHHISRANEQQLASMTSEEIEKERKSILDQLGNDAPDLLKRVREARERKLAREAAQETEAERNVMNSEQTERPPIHHPKPTLLSLGARPGILRVRSLESVPQSGKVVTLSLCPTPPTFSSQRSCTRPPSRTGKKIRFAEVTPKDIYVYESAPVSPKRQVFALPPPPDKPDSSIVSLGTFKGSIPSKRPHPIDSPSDDKESAATATGDSKLEEGTPEHIRRRYFPDAPENDPNLEWMQASTSPDSSELRFDLNGAPIPPPLSETLPSHLGLHHHAEGNRAGYTLDDIFLLSRSTVPAQRASMLGVLAKVVHRLGTQFKDGNSPDKIAEFVGKEGELRKQALAAGLSAISERGSVGAMAVEVVWECLVVWDDRTADVEGIELHLAPDVISSTHPEQLLPIIAGMLVQPSLPRETLEQLLAIVYRFAQESNELANSIMTAPHLVSAIIQTFLLTPIPPREDSFLPDPMALRLLIILASASRSNASTLLEPADALLRFATLLPDSSPFPTPLATSLLIQTLRFYRILASYGLYSHIATSASFYFSALGSYVLSPPPLAPKTLSQLRAAWSSLLEVWIVCATDPHATTPPHEILWSQVTAWGWESEVRLLRKDLTEAEQDWEVWSVVWNVEAAWLEGARINGVKGGEKERAEVLDSVQPGFEAEDGLEHKVVRAALEAVKQRLGTLATDSPGMKQALRLIVAPTRALSSAIRLWLACLPPLKDVPLGSPPFTLPFGELSKLCAELVTHPVWSLPQKRGMYLQVHLRPLSSLLVYFHRLSRHIPGTGPDLWLAQGLSMITRLIPGDESAAIAIEENCILPVTPQITGFHVQLPSVATDILKPFFEHTIRPSQNVYFGPLHVTTESISRSATLRLPGGAPDLPEEAKTGLPLPRDWLTAPLTHLLRSGTSPVFRNLPTGWDASEVEVVRATLLLLHVSSGVLRRWGLGVYALGPAEVVFACMKVCMLEHGVGGGASGMDSSVEVFRDSVVEKLMQWLLHPFTPKQLPTPPPSPPTTATCSEPTSASLPRFTPQNYLEIASQTYLSQTHTPFYQFYTDLVALYTSVSFAHPIFGALLIPVLAMRYPSDYRRLVWCEAGDGSRASSGVGGDVREYLYPVERDGRILGAYLQALLAGSNAPQGFLRLVAVHHVACSVWPDLQKLARAAEDETRPTLLRLLLNRGDAPAVRDVLLYRQSPRSGFLWPPSCFECDLAETDKAERVEYVRDVISGDMAERVKVIFGWKED
ncbi:hypothetical protein BKA82DRAFT_154479 [Pisolithus tinctorius]|uniref:RNA polymerase II-associated protein 1 C-terminal domain-containing protein n=1 Tax=Pisolithus tinctorius Marx 270 TaxID=870435 RepID=A0A0C3NWK2_PISTI|nr:hypothetical protein BKA82DRAFT_154479 [Pisolithus tinctorius]KIN99740.1 hypothetical protein M404DRAFT_154479 [Pisolithus tinctorius Marx 270]